MSGGRTRASSSKIILRFGEDDGDNEQRWVSRARLGGEGMMRREIRGKNKEQQQQ